MREYRILHLEDSHSDADVVKRVLLKENLNFQYFFADDKESFIHGLTDFKPDVILCDHALPQFNSIMAFDIQKQMKFEIPFILVTGTVSEEYAVEMLKKGIDDYLLKTNLQRLPQAIKSAFDKRKNEKGIKEGIKKLENSESRMKEAQKIAHLGNWELDFETRIGIWSDEACRIYGLSPEDNEQTFENWISFIHPDDLEYVMKIVNKAQKTLVDSKMNHRIVLKDGTIKHVSSKSKFNIDSTGKPIGIYGIVHDITERKKVEESLRQSETNLLAIFENTSSGFLLLDENLNVISFNNQMSYFSKELFGVDLQKNVNLIAMFMPEKQQEYKNLFSMVLKGETSSKETSYPQTDGNFIWYCVEGNPVLNQERNIAGVCLTVDNITERKNEEEERFRLSSILEATSDFVGIADANQQIIYFNEAGRKRMGYGLKEDLSQKKIFDFLPDWANEIIGKEGIPAILKVGRWIGETAFLTRGGEEIPVSQVIIAHNNANGELMFLSTICRDITFQKEMTEKLKIQNKKLYEIAFLQSHQVRGPISSILGLISLFNSDNPNDSINTVVIENLKKTTVAFDEIINEIVQKTIEIEDIQ